MQRFWKRISSKQREKAIRQIVDEIECQKSMLTLWYGQECLQETYTVKENMGEYGMQLRSIVREKSRSFVIQRLPLKNLEMGQLKSEFRKFCNQHASEKMARGQIQGKKFPLQKSPRQQKYLNGALEASNKKPYQSAHLSSAQSCHGRNQSYRNQVRVWNVSKQFSRLGILFQCTKDTRSRQTSQLGSSSPVETTLLCQTCVKAGNAIVIMALK